MDSEIVQLVGYVLGFAGVIITVLMSNKSSRDQITSSLKTDQALMNQKIEAITQEIAEIKVDVKEHNNYAQRMPVIEEQLKNINKVNFTERISALETQSKVMQEKIEVANHRLSDAEQAIEALKSQK